MYFSVGSVVFIGLFFLNSECYEDWLSFCLCVFLCFTLLKGFHLKRGPVVLYCSEEEDTHTQFSCSVARRRTGSHQPTQAKLWKLCIQAWILPRPLAVLLAAASLHRPAANVTLTSMSGSSPNQPTSQGDFDLSLSLKNNYCFLSSCP